MALLYFSTYSSRNSLNDNFEIFERNNIHFDSLKVCDNDLFIISVDIMLNITD
jgi:hypothetical protein